MTEAGDETAPSHARKESFSAQSQNSFTAAEYINQQLQLEADAREALPFSFEHCTRPLGALRQLLYSCLTCNPPPETPSESYRPAAVCYSCSISCHGEHRLVELFSKRNFVCDCGTTRMPATSCCSLRINSETGLKGGVHSEEPAPENRYNKNFRNMFCGCGEEYDPHTEKGTMYQCLGLGTVEDGGCGEDWWHPECLVGVPRGWYVKAENEGESDKVAVKKEAEANGEEKDDESEADDDPPLPSGFPGEDDFCGLICYKCVESNPWIKRYAGTPGFLGPVYFKPNKQEEQNDISTSENPLFKKRKLVEEAEDPAPPSPKPSDIEDTRQSTGSLPYKKQKLSEIAEEAIENQTSGSQTSPTIPTCKYSTLPPPPSGRFSLFFTSDFRTSFCHCPKCFPLLSRHPSLLEEEEIYEPPLSESSHHHTQHTGTGSLLERGEAALSNIDRVRAIEGVMMYNHLRDKVKDFLKPFAESGTPVGAEDIKKYFEGLRGDAEGIRRAAAMRRADNDSSDNRKEQSGF